MEDKPYETLDGNSDSWSVDEFLTLRRRAKLWLVPALVALTAVVGSWIAVGVIESTFQRTLEKKLRTIVSATANSVDLWSEQQTLNARILAEDDRTQRLVARLANTDEVDKVQADSKTELIQRLENASQQFGFQTFTVIDAFGETIATNASGRRFSEAQLSQFSQVFCGEAVFAEPAATLTSNAEFATRPNSLYVAAPIQRKRGDEILATLVCELPSDGQFQRTLAVSNFGETGRNYAVDRSGKRIGRDFTTNAVSTKIATSEDSHGDLIVVDADGFVDATGKRLVAATKWLPELGLGVVSTIDYDEAYASHNLFKRINSVVTGFALLGSFIGLIYTWHLSRAQVRAMKAERQLQKLGQYSLEEKIGEGGMGEVYRATHQMLRRPTAVKLLPAMKSSPQTIERFEREVQLTSQLTHPNTVSIYDYGRTSEGVFYYAMEYLEGIDLKKLVEREGAQPEARVVHILRQICGSLEEAHDRGLVHRDIKPANVILCRRGGRYDVAKLLDFGLVYDAKCLRASMEESGISGTPAFMSPESIDLPASVDHRSDIYSIGAVAYFLLTGTYTFTGSSVSEIWNRQLTNIPLAPSARISRPITSTLEQLTMRCLSVDPDRRPQSIKEVEEILAGLLIHWSQEQAEQRWLSPTVNSNSSVGAVIENQPAETLAFAG